MKTIFKFKKLLLTIALMMYFTAFYALTQDVSEAVSITPLFVVEALTPVLVLCATWLSRKYLGIKNLPDVVSLLVVTVLSVALPLVADLFGDSTLPFMARVGLGVGSVFLNQFYKKIIDIVPSTDEA